METEELNIVDLCLVREEGEVSVVPYDGYFEVIDELGFEDGGDGFGLGLGGVGAWDCVTALLFVVIVLVGRELIFAFPS